MRIKPMDTSDLPCLCGGENGKPCKTGSVTAYWDEERERWIYRCGRGESGGAFSEGTIWRVLFELRSGISTRNSVPGTSRTGVAQPREMQPTTA